MAIGRISGPLLKSNLIRDGVDLAFENDLLYLNVSDSRIGINTATPEYTLDVVGTTRSSNLNVTGSSTIGDFGIAGNTITSSNPIISFVASGGEATIYHSRVVINDIEFDGNSIYTNVSNSNLELIPNGTGIVNIQSSVNVTGDINIGGNIETTGDVTVGGNLNLAGSVTINASINGDLIPGADNTYNLGSPTERWAHLYVDTLVATTFYLGSFQVGNVTFNNNTISTTGSNDLTLDANGTGAVKIGNFEITGNSIQNIASNAITELSSTGDGYFKISGTNGFVPPRGSTAARPTAYAVAGMTRYNTDTKALEVWDASVSNWVSPAGTIGAVSESTALQIAAEMALTLG